MAAGDHSRGAAPRAERILERACLFFGLLQTGVGAVFFKRLRMRYTDDVYVRTFLSCSTPEPRDEPGRVPLGHLLEMVHVVYSESKEWTGLLTSMTSLAKHLSEPEHCTIHLILRAEYMPMARGVISCFKHELQDLPVVPRVELHAMQLFMTLPSEEDWAIGASEAARSNETFARFFLHKFMPAAPRAIWIDSDTLIRHDVAKLYRMPMAHPLATVVESTTLDWYPEAMRKNKHWALANYTERLLGEAGQKAGKMQAGVLVLDIQRWAAEGLAEKSVAMFERLQGFDNDQGALNMLLWNDRDLIDWRWNVCALGNFPVLPPQRCVDGARIFHWAGTMKPWKEESLFRRITGLQLETRRLYTGAATCKVVAEPSGD
eukprot:CAMPEP_0204514682 /NCGR_PEP_ID=MMETSP0661-20131031/2208_1 /ASSEMBLY_ACC=CAM_ASM_000606 /TAXON_ID=109239 /ORGANISM="Alexandrium margalefi, Strain AMGDE01CS-322" /LENGTH=374 /DNA_ID=CAMNT_0051519943 /DNA_START=29 /DNA_END=1153 /DNA_ORIENTATION=-